MEGFTPSVLMMIILAVIIGFAVGCFFMKQREKIKEAKKKLHTSEQEHEEDEDNEYEEEIMKDMLKRYIHIPLKNNIQVDDDYQKRLFEGMVYIGIQNIMKEKIERL